MHKILPKSIKYLCEIRPGMNHLVFGNVIYTHEDEVLEMLKPIFVETGQKVISAHYIIYIV